MTTFIRPFFCGGETAKHHSGVLVVKYGGYLLTNSRQSRIFLAMFDRNQAGLYSYEVNEPNYRRYGMGWSYSAWISVLFYVLLCSLVPAS